MKLVWLLVSSLGLALLLVVVGLTGCSPTNANTADLVSSQPAGIWVSGLGEVTITPDIAILRLGIVAQEDTITEAQTTASKSMSKVMTALTDSGVAEKDIQTQYFNIRQRTKWDRDDDEEIVIGYQVTNKVVAKIRDIDKVGFIIDTVVTAGGDLTRIDNIAFSVDDPSAYYKEAREKAMADARTKAEQLAKLAGVTLGTPTYISEGPRYSQISEIARYQGGMAPAPALPTPISPGELEVSLNVQVAYNILQ